MKGIKPNYYNIERKDILILFPPGLGKASHFNSLVQSNNQRYGIITFDLPGVNPNWYDSDVKDIAYEVVNVLKELKQKNIIMMGDSYGGVVLIEVLRQYKGMTTNVLLGSGEFFNTFIREFLKILFFLPTKSRILRRIYAKVLDYLGIFKIGNYSDRRLEIINKRWIGILNYKLPKGFISLNKTYFVKGNGDIIINRGSKEKLKKIFPNFVVIKTDNGHFDYNLWFEKQFV